MSMRPVARGMRIEFRFVPLPQEIWTEDRHLSLAAMRLLGYLLLHQVRFGREIVAVSDDELLNGRRSKTGERLDLGCGVKGRNNLKRGREELEALGWIETEATFNGRRYRVVLSESDKAVSESDAGVSESDSPNRTRGRSVSDVQVSETDTRNKKGIKSSSVKTTESACCAVAVGEYKPTKQSRTAGEEWRLLLEDIAEVMNPHTFDTWVKPSKAVALDAGVLRVALPSTEFVEMVGRQSEMIAKIAAARACGRISTIEFVSEGKQ